MIGLLWTLACGAGTAVDPAPSATTALPDPVAGSSRTVQVPDLVQALQAGAVPILVDVRTPEEFAEGHVPGALNIPLGELDGRLQELQPHRSGEVWVICAVGGRSARASRALSAAGFHAVNVDGGTRGWIAQGGPTE